ncbi:sugar phosphate isomerase/epimerase family protein [Chitinophaga cymbidii]|uniref:Xylose isomerase-like TIM barrel domain-containing protein n=1 Tax=Chitinophaga cymbidii TaxID=1096750 RepID=A0A512RIS5_9BACT|nr:TIM barrel protein [Chitinophaga cymbidii]GEP95580.1 hypothetical protein CCY01nite_18400 [Chitinophaga cymbidii]
MPYTRRNFIQTLAMAGAAFPLRGLAGKAAPAWEIHCFSKPFQWMDYDLLCETFAAAGLDGVDYTVRPGGHVLPEKVADDLPKAVAAVKKAGMKAVMMTTAILDAKEKYTEDILQTAAGEGIRYYRMGWYEYLKDRPLLESLHHRGQQLKELTLLNRKYNIRAAYQNHAGKLVGASVWDLYEMIKDVDPAFTGVQYDIRHATVEGANSWPLGLQLIRPFINTLVIKDTRWTQRNGRYVLENVPLGEGMVDFAAFFRQVKQLGIHVPVTLHLEYELLSKAEEALPVKQKQQIVLNKLKKDVDTLKGWLA